MSKLINEMLKEGDQRLVLIVSDETCMPHEKGDFHSFYYPCGSGYLQEISDWGYNNKLKELNGLMYGLMNSDEFVSEVPVDVSTYLFANGFVLDGKKWKKKSASGSISDGWNGRQSLVWEIVVTDEDGDEYERSICLDVTNSTARFLVVLDKLLKLDPVKDCGLKEYLSYQIRYECGSIGLCAPEQFVDADEIIKYYKLFEVIQKLN